MSTSPRERHLHVERIELELDGLSATDARLLAAELPAALESRLGRGGAGAAAGSDEGPLVSALTGRALIDAIADRLVDAIGQESALATGDEPTEESPWR